MIFLFTEIDHPSVLKEKGNPEADHVLASQLFLIEETLHSQNVHWMKRTPRGVLAIFQEGEPAKAAILLQKKFQDMTWERFGKAKIRVALHAGDAEKFGQSYLGPDMVHANKLLEAAYGGQILLTHPAVHFIPLPPGGKLIDMGSHFLKDLSEAQNLYSLQHPDILPEESPSLRSFQTYPQNIPPQSSPFYGREEEITEITQILTQSQVRLVTLIGPGGFGKTRLALQAAAETVEKFKDGVYLVSLAPLLSDQLIVGSIANAIKFYFFGSDDPQTQLLNHLKEKEMLLVMDNFEHIIEGAELVREMIQAAPGLKILVTTREGLKIEGEKIVEVRGLRYPDEGRTQEMEASGAVQLFLKSARRIRPDFSLDNEDRENLLKICRLLEGMPLGLEISATWVGNLSLAEIAHKIESSRDFLATSMPHLPPRHRSLRAVFEYSWILLSDSQKKSFKGISVFKGGFDAPAALAVAEAGPALLGYLENKSLLRKRSDGRFEIHELLKYYAKEKLFDDPMEKERIFDAHCVYFGLLVRDKEKELSESTQNKALGDLVEEMGNIREGWKRAVEKTREKDMGHYLDGLFAVYDTKGWFQEAQEAFEKAAGSLHAKFGRSAKPLSSSLLLARVLSRQAAFEIDLGRSRKAQKLLEESLDLFREAKAPKSSGFALSCMGTARENHGDYIAARGYFEKSLKVYRQIKDGPGIAWALNNLGHISARLGENEKAQQLIRQSLAYSESHGDFRAMAYSYNLLGDALRDLGRVEESKSFYQKGLQAYLKSGDRRGLAWSFANLGTIASAEGDYSGARQMYRESMAISRDLGDRRALAWAKNLLGVIGWCLGEYKEALQLFEEGFSLYQEIEDLRGEAWSLDLMGNIHLAMMKGQEAEKCYLKSYSLVMKEGANLQNVAWNYFHLGAVSLLREDFPEAKERFRKALRCFEKLDEKTGQLATLTHLGEVACAQREFLKSEKYFQGAVRKALETAASPLLVDVMVGLAKLLQAKGEEKQAITFLMMAITHPTCRQQTKDRVVPFALDLKSKFAENEVEGIIQWCKASNIREVAYAWLVSGRPVKSTTKKSKAKKKLRLKPKPRRKLKRIKRKKR